MVDLSSMGEIIMGDLGWVGGRWGGAIAQWSNGQLVARAYKGIGGAKDYGLRPRT